ncbi:MAG: 4Fe-4S dicluster domain-containing protein [Epsilonproteobacteria bacterium]|nr:4Fe-4S dicluster domain-containing protein [Campylobacterota bacterium]
MSVIISEECINCDACRQQCPVNAIVDDAENPTGNSRYYVYPEKCVECVDIYEDPQCASICPSIGTITWDLAFVKAHTEHFVSGEAYALSHKGDEVRSPEYKEKKYRTDIPASMRGVGELVEVAPEEVAS